MRIGTDIASLQAQHSLERTSKAFARALQRLASGKRINSAGDDAAGLAISNGLDSQVRAMKQSLRNLNEANAVLQTTEGAIASQVELVQRMRELAMQAANGTLGSFDREYLDAELQSLFAEYQRTIESTEVGGQSVLKGFDSSIQVGAQNGEMIDFSIPSIETSRIFQMSYIGTTGNTENPGFGTFSFATTLSFSADPRYASPGDFNDDDKQDIVYTTAGGAYLRLGNGDGTFRAASTILSTGSVDINSGDLNGDGKEDIIFGNQPAGTPTLIVRLGNGDGTFAHSQTISTLTGSTGLTSLELGDLDKDGDLDVVSAGANNTFFIQINNGDGTFTQSAAITVGGPEQVRDVVLRDFTGDGILDVGLAVQNLPSIKVFAGDGQGGVTQVYNGGAHNTLNLVAEDFNGDGKMDIINSDYQLNRLLIRFGNGDGTFTSPATLFSYGSGTPNTLLAKDVNGDDKMDLIVSRNAAHDILIYLGNDDGSFALGQTLSLPAGTSPGELEFGDFNGDHAFDLISMNPGNDTASIYLGDTTGTFDLDESDVSIRTQAAAQNSLLLFDSALSRLSQARAQVGAIQSRLEAAYDVNSVTVENLAQAKSNILDTDFAEETAELTKQQILQQAGVSVMAQAQLQMQMVLSLLKNL